MLLDSQIRILVVFSWKRRRKRGNGEGKRRERRKEKLKIVLERREAETEGSSVTEEQSSPNNTRKRKIYCCSTPESSQSNSYLADALVQGLELLECKDMMLAPLLEDSDWLYPDRRSEDKRQRYVTDTVSCSRASTSGAWPPRAQYLHHIDAYALPYILPFWAAFLDDINYMVNGDFRLIVSTLSLMESEDYVVGE